MRTGRGASRLPFRIPDSPFRSRPAFTLVELVFSLVIVSVLMLAVGSVLRLALVTSGGVATTGADGSNGYAGSVGAASAASRQVAADAADQIAADLNVALTFTEKTNTAVTFTVPNRTGGTVPDTLRYAWSGSAGTATATPPVPAYTLTRELNGGPWAALATDVRTCNFSVLYRTMTVTAAPTEQLLLSWDPSSGSSTTAWYDTFNWGAVSFKPTFAGSPASYTITRVRLNITSDLSYDGVLRAQFRTAGNVSPWKPTSTVLEEVKVPELAGSDTGAWVDVNFSTLKGLSPGQWYALTIGGSSGLFYGGAVATVGSAPSNVKGFTSSTSGGSWTAAAGSVAMRVYVYGTIP